jgi:PAS domain S-box-containing protein
MTRKSYLAAIVESSDDAIIPKNLDGTIQACTAAAERLFGYTSAELIGQSVRILIPPDRQILARAYVRTSCRMSSTGSNRRTPLERADSAGSAWGCPREEPR